MVSLPWNKIHLHSLFCNVCCSSLHCCRQTQIGTETWLKWWSQNKLELSSTSSSTRFRMASSSLAVYKWQELNASHYSIITQYQRLISYWQFGTCIQSFYKNCIQLYYHTNFEETILLHHKLTFLPIKLEQNNLCCMLYQV